MRMAKSEMVVKYEIKPDDAAALLAEVTRLREGIEDIAGRLDGWTDHDGIGPKEALLALIAPKDSVNMSETDNLGMDFITVVCGGVSYEGRVFRGGKMVSFPTDIPDRVHDIVAEYFREPVGEMRWDLLA
jgi:hypothetical protein